MGSEASSQRNRRPAKEAPGSNLALPDDSLQRESLGCKWFHSLRVGRTEETFPEVTLTYESDSSLGKGAYNSLSTLSNQM